MEDKDTHLKNRANSIFLQRIRSGVPGTTYSSDGTAFYNRTQRNNSDDILLQGQWRKQNSCPRLDVQYPYQNGDLHVVDVVNSHGSEDRTFFNGSEDSISEELSVTIYKNVIKQNLLDYMKSSCGGIQLLEEIERGNITAVNLDMLESKPVLEKNIAFLWTALLKKHELLPGFVKYGADLQFCDLNGFSALHLAAFGGDIQACKYLISMGADVNLLKQRYTPLHLAAFGNSYKVTRLLLENGGVIKHADEWDTPIHSAVKANAVQCLQLITTVASDINSTEPTGMAPLHIAADLGQLQCLKILLTCEGIDVNVKTKGRECTPLHLASENGYNECVAILLVKGARSDERNQFGQTALHLAAKAQSVECVEALLGSRGCDVNAKDKDNRTPLHAAVGTDSHTAEVVDALIRRGADVNAVDYYGCTPLHIAALNELSQCVETLFRHGANVTAKTNVGITALSIISRKLPMCLGMIHKKLNEAITIYDAEIPHKEVKLKLDFRTILHHSKDGEVSYLQTFVDDGHKEILQHPLCEAFLDLKWQKTRKFYAIRLIVCFLFILSLTVYAFSIAHVCFRSSSIPPNGSTTPDEYGNISTYDLNSTKLNENSVNNSHVNKSPSINNTVENLSHDYQCYRKHQTSKIWSLYVIDPRVVEAEYIILLIFTVCEILRKICTTFGYSPFRRYFFQVDNLLDWFIVISVFAIAIYKESIQRWQKDLAAIVVLLGWTSLMYKIGQLPFFGPYVPMFVKVLKEFAKLFLAYCFLLIGFTISLCIIMPVSDEFMYPHVGFIKVLVMMTGELNWINFLTVEKEHTNVMLVLIFPVFIFLVTIVMMNLQVGIAVHDIQGLQKTAVLSKLERQLTLISHIERALFNIKLFSIPQSVNNFLKQVALVSPSAYRVVLEVKPFSPRERKLPKEILNSLFKIARNRKRRNAKRNKKSTKFRGNSTKCNDSSEEAIHFKQLRVEMESNTKNIKELRIEVQELKTIISRLVETFEIKERQSSKED